MRKLMIALTIALACAPNAAQAKPDVRVQVERLLTAYAAGDVPTVRAMVEPNLLRVYGTDIAEVVEGAAAFEQMLANDQRLWGGHASFGPMRHVSVVQGQDMASVYFDAPFKVGDRPEVTVRFATTWRLVGGSWKLVQAENTVPTVGQSAEAILRSMAH